MAKTDKVGGATTIAVVGFDGCSSWITAGLLELFAIANVASGNLPRHSRSQPRRFECHVVGAAQRPIRGSHQVRFTAHPLRRHYDAVIVPPIWCESRDELIQRAQALQSLTPLLQQLSRRSTIMTSACSGAVLLANAGLLSNHRATTCWWLASWFQQRFPDVELVPDKLVMIDADRWTAAAGSAYIHLGLELVSELAGVRVSAATARLLLVERRRGSQSPFMATEPLPAERLDPQVQRAARYLDEHVATPLTVSQACRALCVNERTLTRKFQAVMGMSPLTYLQSRRIARGRQLLEDTLLPLESIVGQCGYEDVSSFRKLFTRHVGMTPREYRSRFGSAPVNRS